MATDLSIIVRFEDDSDCEFLRVRCVGAVEDVVEMFIEEGRNDGTVTVDWEVE